MNVVRASNINKLFYSSSSGLTEARQKLRELGGGKVNLKKNEENGLAFISLDNEEKKNAMSGKMMTQFEDIVDDLEQWKSGKGVILMGKGDFFCSGGDISSQSDFILPETGSLMCTFMQSILTRFFTLPLITVSALNGPAIGGGAELTTATDFRLFKPSSYIAFVQGRMGVVTGWGGGTRLSNSIGSRLALDLLLTSRKVLPSEAIQIGLADAIIENDDFLDHAEQWLLSRLTHHSSVTRAMKEIVIGARELPPDRSLINEKSLFIPLWGGPVNLDALSKKLKHN